MANKGKISMMSLFEVVDRSKLKFLTDEDILKDVLTDKPLQPENLEDSKFDPNMFIVVKHAKKDIKHLHGKQVLRKEHHEPNRKISHEDDKKKEKVYRKGPFAEFYEFSEGTLDKDAEVWYYKEGKQIIGPVSSYNMDKMVYHKTIHAETKVAFKSVEKFLKFSKVQAILQQTKAQEEENAEKEHSSTTHESSKPAVEATKPAAEEKKPEPAPVAVAESPKEPPKKLLNLSDPDEFPPL